MNIFYIFQFYKKLFSHQKSKMMKRSLGGFLIIAGIILSTFAYSYYNLSSATDTDTSVDATFQPNNLFFYFFFASAAIGVIGGVVLISIDEEKTP